MCKVLIADDSDIMRTAIRKTLEEASNIKIVGEASTFAETRQKIVDLKPDVLLLGACPKSGPLPCFGESTAGNRMHACHIVI